MAIPVTLEVFEGPLDLLLYLIEKNKVDIYDIPIVTITDQYMAYIKAMEDRDMNIMSEFLVMAATLIDIKCRMLLPKEVNEEGEEEDPRDELVQKLLEYKMVRFLSVELKDRQLESGFNLYHKKNIPPEVASHEEPIDYDALIGDLNLAALNDIFQSILKRQEDKIDPVRSSFGNIEKEEIDISLKATYIEAYTREHKRFSFRSLLEKQGSKAELIVTFLVVLEMIRIGKVTIEQKENFSDIIITNNDDNNERIDLAQIG
ncbi:condensin subunit ScpA [Lachnospiraceae bacterium XBB2008]|nr:segregation/condensation protein A [Lachnospiraceae bacterium]SCX79287.1 condensin subunit ScpA [Lachnospiraceae bacterium XBB2008]